MECKKPGDNLSKSPTKAQLKKYSALSNNILLTDSWNWLLLRGGKSILSATLTKKKLSSEAHDKFTELLCAFMQSEVEKIGDAGRLAAALAGRCAILRKGLAVHESDNPRQSSLHGLLGHFQNALDSKLDFAQFADTFAQTLVYSLLLAKLKAPSDASLDLYNINRYIPANFAVIREITALLQQLNDSHYKGIAWVVDDILATINSMDAAAVSESMSYQKNGSGFDNDPYIYFYENFLATYNAKLRKSRGVYYTPPPVVKFIVGAVDDLLKSEFALPGGLAEADAVTTLDFAAGTGTFMLEMIRCVLQGASPARRDILAHGHILKNFYGFELLMAPYAIAHLKLSQFLADNGVPLQEDERINIFLTNTLEPVSNQVELPMMPKLAEDVNRAQKIKDTPVLVITGNPPYSITSQNKGEWISKLIDSYKQINGKKLQESNLKVLLDDYVKFIRFAQWKMKNVDRGIVAIITNHGFLDNPTFRGMRKSLLDTFDALYFLDLHGNANKKEKAPDGSKDENVFDIRQGVAISLLVKNSKAKKKGVFRADLYGKRVDKYKTFLDNDINTVQWKEITPTYPFYLFIVQDRKAAKRYEKHHSVKDMFIAQSTGIKSHRDHFAFAFDADEIKTRIDNMRDTTISTEDSRVMYALKDTQDWSLASARQALVQEHSFSERLKPCLYRPFDIRWCYYGKETMERWRPQVMRHMLEGGNLGLATVRQVKAGRTWQHCLVSGSLIESTFVSNKTGEITYLFPLYHYDDHLGITTRRENLKPEFRQWINDRYGVTHTPEDILGCIYAILHSPDYRKRYADFLRIDFPRIPFPTEGTEFTRLASIGGQLIDAHLLRNHCTGELAEHAGSNTEHEVNHIRYDQDRLYFNKTEYFAPLPPEVSHFQIGGYQPLDKYLKSRKGRALTIADTNTIYKAANAIAFTIEKMKEIDG